jgi:hypothetical protein
VRPGKKKFSELSPAGRVWTVVLILASLVLVGAAERDIQRRQAGEVEGNKLIWRLVSLNALGALSYFAWGRRTSDQAWADH